VAKIQEENLSEMSQSSTSEEVGRQEDLATLIHLWLYMEEFLKMVGCKKIPFECTASSAHSSTTS